MGRLPKKGVEYFPHDTIAASTPTLFVMQEEFGNDGYAFWFKLLEFLGMKATLSADFTDRKDWRYFLAKAKVTEEQGNAMLNVLADVEAIDKELWEKHRVVWSDNFAGRLEPLYSRREDSLPTKPVFDDMPSVHTQEQAETPPEQEQPEQTEQPKKRKKKSSSTVDKKQYAEFVSMTETEYASLIERVGERAAEKCVEVLDNYKGSTGKTYQSDYRTILNWVIEKVRKEHGELFSKTEPDDTGGNPFD